MQSEHDSLLSILISQKYRVLLINNIKIKHLIIIEIILYSIFKDQLT